MLLEEKHFDPNHTHAYFVHYLEQKCLKPGDNLDIDKYNEDVKGHRIYIILEEHHFDEEQVNPYFVYYIKSLGLKPNYGVVVYEFKLWAQGKASEYISQFPHDAFTTIGNLPGGHKAFGEYLKSFAEHTAEPEQLSLF